MRGASISGHVGLRDVEISSCALLFENCTFSDGISLDGAKIGELTLLSCELRYLSGVHVEVRRSVTIVGSEVGELDLANARIATELVVSDSRIGVGTGAAICCDRIETGSVVLNGSSVLGEIRMVGATIAGPLAVRNSILTGSVGRAVTAESTSIDSAFFFTGCTVRDGECNVAYLRVGGPLVDDMASWPDAVRLSGFEYRSLEGADTAVGQRLRWLARDRPFTPGPYSYLAKVYREAGQEKSARTVAIQRERERRRRGELSRSQRLLSLFMGAVVAHGYKPWRVLVPFVVVLAIGTALFSLPPAYRVMAATKPAGPPSAAASCVTYPCYFPPAYVFDALVPVMDLHQETNWEAAAGRPWGFFYRGVMWILIMSGWLMTTSVIAGFSLAWRRE